MGLKTKNSYRKVGGRGSEGRTRLLVGKALNLLI